jgi:tRNA threonylcarbamoyladenosine modification (KEOPS) complex Cgi121 subunit
MTNISDAIKRHSEKGGNCVAFVGKEDIKFFRVVYPRDSISATDN